MHLKHCKSSKNKFDDKAEMAKQKSASFTNINQATLIYPSFLLIFEET